MNQNRWLHLVGKNSRLLTSQIFTSTFFLFFFKSITIILISIYNRSQDLGETKRAGVLLTDVNVTGFPSIYYAQSTACNGIDDNYNDEGGICIGRHVSRNRGAPILVQQQQQHWVRQQRGRDRGCGFYSHCVS